MNQLSTNNRGQEQAEMTTRFSPFGVFIMWLGLVPMCLAMLPINPVVNVIGTVMLGIYIFGVYNRCDDLGLMTVKVLKKSDDDDRPLIIVVAICFIAMLAYFASFGFNPKLFLTAYAILVTIITFRVEVLNEYKPGELK